MVKVKAVVFPAKEQIEIRELELVAMEPELVRTETLYSFVSPGTELRTLAGYYDADKNYPIVPGYSSVDRIVEVGSAVKGWKVGDLLDVRGGCGFKGATSYWGGEMGGHMVHEDWGNVLLPREAAANPLAYAVVEVAGISCRGVTSADPQPGEQAVVIGQGMIGSFVAELLRLAGCTVTVADVNANRLDEARKAGFEAELLDGKTDVERLKAHSGLGFDIVAECSGSIAGVKLAYQLVHDYNFLCAIRQARKGWPRLLLQANYVEEVTINPCSFFRGEGVIVLTPSDRQSEDRMRVVELIRRGLLKTERFTKNVFTPGQMPEAYRMLQRREINSVVCKWN